MDASPAFVAVHEAETDVDTIYWCFDRQMYSRQGGMPGISRCWERYFEYSLSVKSANSSQTLRSLLLLEEVNFISVTAALWVGARHWSCFEKSIGKID